MQSLALRWFVLLFTVAWFGVLVPIHQRGAIQLPGSPVSSCCVHKNDGTAAKACHGEPQQSQNPTRNSSGNCAVCFFVAGLDLPAPVMLDVPPLGPAEPVAQFDLPVPAEREHIRTHFERGPPLA
jgi:hypothetical protein